MVNQKIQLEFILILLTGVVILSFFILKPFLATLVLSAMFAVILHPFYLGVLKRIKNRESIASLITVLFSIVCILIPFTFLGAQIFNESVQLYSSITREDSSHNIVITTINNLGETSEKFLPGSGDMFVNFSANINVYVEQGLKWFINHLGIALSSFSSLLLDLFIFFISLFYLLKDGNKLKKAIVELSPLKDTDDEIVFSKLESAVSSVLKGNLTIAFIQGMLTAVGFTIFGIPNAILWGTFAIIASLVPNLGSALIIIPGVTYLFVIGDSVQAFGLMLWGMFAVGLIDNFLGPKLIGSKLQLHPLFVLLSVLGGIALFGPVGIFIGPLTMSLLFAFISIYSVVIRPQ